MRSSQQTSINDLEPSSNIWYSRSGDL